MAQPIPKVPLPPLPRATGSRVVPPPRSRGPLPTMPEGPPPAQNYQSGSVIAGKYRLASLIGEGGMGAVWRARNMDLDVEVALKLIRSDATLSDATDRLLREAQAAAKLIDPSIVRVFDFGRSEQGDPFIVMELLEGEDLAAAIQRRGRLSPKRAVRVLLPVMRALSVAHQNGIVHRDLKPENVFLSKTPNGLQPKVVDFGIAQLDKAQGLRLTSTGALMGSPLYMSPEQAKGEPVDFRADIWGITAVLYEAITGKSPFPGPNYNAVLCAIMLKDPERPADEFGVDEELWSLIARGLAKEPAFRFESMRHTGQALARWLIECGEQADITGASLETQWLLDDPTADQLTTVFPPTAEVRTEIIERNAPTQRLSRDPGVAAAAAAAAATAAATAATAAKAPPRRRGLLLGVVAAGLLAGLAIGWAALRSNEPEAAPTAETAPKPKPVAKPKSQESAQIRASEPATPPEAAEAPPPAADEPAPEPSEADSAEAAAPADTSAPAEPPTTRREPRPRPSSVSRPSSGKRTSKLKNPFAP